MIRGMYKARTLRIHTAFTVVYYNVPSQVALSVCAGITNHVHV